MRGALQLDRAMLDAPERLLPHAASLAVALVCDHAFGPARLHRLQADIRPENGPSLAVVRKLGLREEGLRERMLHIDGAWRDHLSFAVTAVEVPEGLHTRFHAGVAEGRHGGSATRT